MVLIRKMKEAHPSMNPTTTSKEIEEAAAAWFAKREGGDWQPADEAQLDAWLEAATAHRVAFIRILTAWERCGRLNALGAGIAQGTLPARDSWRFDPVSVEAVSVGESSDRHTGPRWRRSRGLRVIAALWVIATVAGTVWYFSIDRGKLYRTEIGTVSTVPLSDGSSVTLNTDTQVHVELAPHERRVNLDQGEVFFDVAHDPSRPFTVTVADERIIAVGTQFLVRRQNGNIRVLVTQGRVQIEHVGSSPGAAPTSLDAGFEARTMQGALLIDQPAATQIEQLMSWRTGHLLFRDTTLTDAVAEFNRYTSRKIVIADRGIAGIRIGGSFRSDDIGAFLWLVQSGFPVKVEQRSDRIVLTQRYPRREGSL
jgi:transmembrane sensor